MNVDLNLDNYELKDILALFKINSDFDVPELQKAKKIVLMSHPDKSKLDPDFFRFYLKAYKKLYEIFEFKNKDKLQNRSLVIDYKNIENYLDDNKKTLLDKHFSKKDNKEDFNRWFNKEFEKNNIKREDESSGYGDWLRSNEGLEDVNSSIALSQLGDEIELRKKKISQMIVYNGVNEVEFNNKGTYLTGDVPESFSSDLFSHLPYEDLRKAHTETVVPVTQEDYHNMPKFKNLNDLHSYRDSQDITPLSQTHASQYLANKNRLNEHKSSINAYKLAKQLEEAKKKQDTYWAGISYVLDKTG